MNPSPECFPHMNLCPARDHRLVEVPALDVLKPARPCFGCRQVFPEPHGLLQPQLLALLGACRNTTVIPLLARRAHCVASGFAVPPWSYTQVKLANSGMSEGGARCRLRPLFYLIAGWTMRGLSWPTVPINSIHLLHTRASWLFFSRPMVRFKYCSLERLAS